MRLFGRARRPEPAPATPEPVEPDRPSGSTLTLGRETASGAPVRWALLDRVGLPGVLAVLAPYDARARLFARAIPELALSGPIVAIDPLEMSSAETRLSPHRVGAGRGISLVGGAESETVAVARSAQAVAWWAASGAAWSGAVEAILERTIEVLARAGETPSVERLAHLLREAAARTQDPELRGGCARISEGLFALLGSETAQALFTDPVSAVPTDRELSLSIAPETRTDPLALRLARPGLLRLAARIVPTRDAGSAIIPALADLGDADLVERLAADLLWPLRNAGVGLVVGAERLAPWPERAGLPSPLLARADAWLVSVDSEQRTGWESVLGAWATPAAIGAAFDEIVAAGGDAALIAPALRREPIGLRAFD